MSTRELLIAARARIADEQHWLKGEFAEDTHGQACSVLSPDAYRWCATGALMREARATGSGSFQDALLQLERSGGHFLSYLNDTFSHADLIALFDDVIAAQLEVGVGV